MRPLPREMITGGKTVCHVHGAFLANLQIHMRVGESTLAYEGPLAPAGLALSA
jgi:hypothetical protein